MSRVFVPDRQLLFLPLRRCSYCGATTSGATGCGATGVPLHVEHIVPRTQGRSDRVSNLTLACNPCTNRKETQTAAEFGYPGVQAQARVPLTAAAAVNTTCWALYRRLQAMRLSLETGTGGRTKWHRSQRAIPKTHWLDAACASATTPRRLRWHHTYPLLIQATGRGTRQIGGTNASGFPIRHRTRQRRVCGFQTGDLVWAVLPTGRYAGVPIGRVTIRQRPSFRVNGIDVHRKYCTLVQRGDGDTFHAGSMPSSPSPDAD